MSASAAVSTWIEPARLLVLRWGGYLPRYLVALVLIALGICSVQGTTAYSLPFLAWGTLAQGVGWTILPSRGGRRLGAILPAVLASCLLLAGGAYSSAFGIVLWGWLLVRQRPKATYLLILLPLAYGGAFGGGTFPGSIMVEYAYAWLVFTGAGLLTVGCAWAARAWAKRIDAARRSRSTSAGSGELSGTAQRDSDRLR